MPPSKIDNPSTPLGPWCTRTQRSLGIRYCVRAYVFHVPGRANEQPDGCPGGSGYRDGAAPAWIVTRGHIV